MKRHIVFSLVFVVVVSLIFVVACTPAAAPTPTPQPPTATPVPPTPTPKPPTPTPTPVPPTPTPPPPSPTPSAFPVTVKDDLGREVTISALPQRIVSLAPSNTEILFAIGAGDQVVGVTEYDNYPPEAKTREKVGGFSAKSISVEKIVALKPDLVFSAGKIQQPVIEALEQVNIPVVALAARTFDEVYKDIELAGRLTGHEKEATQVVDQMKRRIAAVQKKVAAIPPEKRLTVFWEVWDEPLITAGPGTFIGQMIEMAGGVNIFDDVTEDWPQVSAEEVVKRNPDVIMGPDTHGDKLTPEQIAQRPGWDQIKAVRNGRIHLINGDIASRPGPRLADALEAIAQALYPDLFK